MATPTNLHSTLIGQAQVEMAVRAALTVQGRRFDSEDITHATSIVMAGLSPQQRHAVAMGDSRPIQTLLPQATARVTVDRTPINWHGAVRDPSRHSGDGRTWASAHGRGQLSAGGDRARSGRDDGDDDGPSGSSLRYASMDMGKINSSNYQNTDFHRSGVDYGTFSELRAMGFGAQNIIHAARDARALGFSPRDRQAMLDHATIDKHSVDAQGMNTALQQYQSRAREDADLNALIRRRQQATTEEEKRALDEQIRTRREEHMRATGLQGRIENPQEDARAREAGQRRKDAIDSLQEEHLRLAPRLTAEAIADQRATSGETAVQQAWAAELAKREGKTDEAEDAALVALAGVTPPVPATGAPAPTTPPPATVQRAETTTTPPPTQTAVATPPRPSGQTLQA
jgi:hypothetical protein